MFDTVLVANRGEIARRVIRTLRRLGIRSIAVYSDADADAPHVREADAAYRIGPAAAAKSYLDGAAILAAAHESGAQAIHPGYGFLSENADFAAACATAGVVFIGPGERALDVMGDKIRAKAHVTRSGVPVVPGIDATGLSDEAIAEAAAAVGYPLLIKPSAGGGGKGMQVVRAAAELREALATARRVASAAFGDDTLLLERLIERPRHIEVQVMADAHGAVIHLGERECTLQRRHQKVIEEAPSSVIDEATRARLGAAACAAAASVDYRGAGTVEFLVAADRPDEFFFIEMNTRLQVEHPVTELVTGLDLVELQLRIAAGESLGIAQDDVVLTGHAIEARVYAESPARGFLPAIGRVLEWTPAPGVRTDSAVETGSAVTSDYDPMIAKVIACGDDRADALATPGPRARRTVLLGLDTNIASSAPCSPTPPSAPATSTPVSSTGCRPSWTRSRAGRRSRPRHPPFAVRPPVSSYARPSTLWQSRLDGWRVGGSACRAVTVLLQGDDGVRPHRRATDVAVPGASTATKRQHLDSVGRPERTPTALLWVHADGAASPAPPPHPT